MKIRNLLGSGIPNGVWWRAVTPFHVHLAGMGGLRCHLHQLQLEPLARRCGMHRLLLECMPKIRDMVTVHQRGWKKTRGFQPPACALDNPKYTCQHICRLASCTSHEAVMVLLRVSCQSLCLKQNSRIHSWEVVFAAGWLIIRIYSCVPWDGQPSCLSRRNHIRLRGFAARCQVRQQLLRPQDRTVFCSQISLVL